MFTLLARGLLGARFSPVSGLGKRIERRTDEWTDGPADCLTELCFSIRSGCILNAIHALALCAQYALCTWGRIIGLPGLVFLFIYRTVTSTAVPFNFKALDNPPLFTALPYRSPFAVEMR